MLAFATVAQKSFKSKFITKNHFPIGHFMLPLLLPTKKSLKFLHTLFDKYLDHMLVKFAKNRMVRNIQNFELFGNK